MANKDEMERFLQNAIQRGLCDEYIQEWSSVFNDKEKLVSLCLRQQSIPYLATSVYEGWGLSIPYILSSFAPYINNGYKLLDCDKVKNNFYELYVQHTIKHELDCEISHYLNCRGEVIIPSYKCANLYISNKSKINIKLSGYNFLFVYIFDESEINIDLIDETSKVVVYKFSESAVVESNGWKNIKVANKKLVL